MPAATNWSTFRTSLLNWYDPAERPMPWKDIRDPYRIWLSEIILQQTRVAQGLPYYERFVAAYPTVGDLAAAPDDEVMKLWEGLGYYSRARNLLKAARRVSEVHGGEFPATYAGLLELPGVGPYTAAAVASFAFGARVPVVDGNVYRVLARYADDATPIDASAARRHYTALATSALGDADARRFNQAIMDFGATVCTPKAAACPTCPLREGCRAYRNGTVYERPVKGKKAARRTRYFHYLVLSDERDRTVVEQRTEKDIWRDLYQFPLLETTTDTVPSVELPQRPGWPAWLPAHEVSPERRSPPHQQQLTHQRIVVVFHHFRWRTMPEQLDAALIVENKMLEKYAFPRVIARYLGEKSLLLDLF